MAIARHSWWTWLVSMAMLVTFSSALKHPKWVAPPLGSRPLAGRYIIEFSDDYDRSSTQFLNELEQEHSSFGWTMAHDYDASPIFRGFSVKLEANDMHLHAANSTGEPVLTTEDQVLYRVMDTQHVKRVFPVTEVPRPKLQQHDKIKIQDLDISPRVNNLPFSHEMAQIDRVHQELGLKGKDVLVGIIDTGVDYYHPALGGGFGAGYKVAKGYDLVGDDFDYTDPSTAHPRETPLDLCEHPSGGHGTHVAGIIGANDQKYNFTGVAPDATLGMWRVFGCTGSTSNDLVIKALLMAYTAGCDVINLSLGEPNSWPEDPAAVVADRIASRNVTVVVAAGNEGTKGAFMVASPSTGNRAISVASVDNAFSLQQMLTTNNGEQYPYTLSSSTSVFPNGTLVAYSKTDTDRDACEGTVPDNNIKGAIVLVKRGTCKFDEKAAVVSKAGGVAMLIYDASGEDSFAPSTPTASIPVAAVSYKTGAQLLQHLQASSSLAVAFSLQLFATKISTAGRLSTFSSVGPSNELGIKPDLAGVGGYVFSTLPLNQGGYGTLSGTSMASPFVAGACALYIQAKLHARDPVTMLSRLQNYARVVPTIEDQPDNPVRQGAGLIQVYDAIQGALCIMPGKVSFNDTAHREPQTLTLINDGQVPVTLTATNMPAVAVLPYDTHEQGYVPLEPPLLNNISALLAFEVDTLTLMPGESRQLSVSVKVFNQEPPDESTSQYPFPIFGGHVRLSADNAATTTVHVPYAGVIGHVDRLPIFAPGFPLVSDYLELATSENLNKPSYTLNRTAETPQEYGSLFILFRLLTGTALFKAEVLNDKQDVIGTAFTSSYLQRNTLDPQGYLQIETWNGTYVPSGFEDAQTVVPIENGTFYLRWQALRLLADPNNPNSWETAVSKPIVVL